MRILELESSISFAGPGIFAGVARDGTFVVTTPRETITDTLHPRDLPGLVAILEDLIGDQFGSNERRTPIEFMDPHGALNFA